MPLALFDQYRFGRARGMGSGTTTGEAQPRHRWCRERTLLLAGMVGTAASSPAALLQVRVPAAPIDDQVDAANNGLKAAKHALVRAQATLDQAASALPQAEQRVQQALAALAQAQAAEARAREAVAAAQKAVAAQRVKIAKTQGEIDALKVQIAGLARQAYTNGGEYQNSKSCWSRKIRVSSRRNYMPSADRPAVTRGPSIRSSNSSRNSKSSSLSLAALEASAKASQQEADDNQAKAQSSKDDAAAAQQQVQQLVAKRQSAVAEADATRTKLKGIYLGLLAERGDWRRRQRVRIRSAPQHGLDKRQLPLGR